MKVINAAAISDEEQEETPAEVADVRQMDRWRRLATAAAKQSLRCALGESLSGRWPPPVCSELRTNLLL